MVTTMTTMTTTTMTMTHKVGDIITLGWVSKRKGKQRIAQHGDQWRIKSISQIVFFSSEPGPWIGIESVNSDDFRTIHATNDKDFKIVD